MFHRLIHVNILYLHEGENMSVELVELQRKISELWAIKVPPRVKLSMFVRFFWSTPEGREIASRLSAAARESGFDVAMESIMSSVAPQIKEAARPLKEKYRHAWGIMV